MKGGPLHPNLIQSRIVQMIPIDFVQFTKHTKRQEATLRTLWIKMNSSNKINLKTQHRKDSWLLFMP